jgi:hypothetical protein
MVSFWPWTMDCGNIRQSGTEWSPHVSMHFQAVFGLKTRRFRFSGVSVYPQINDQQGIEEPRFAIVLGHGTGYY